MFKKIISIPKTIYFNFYYLPFKEAIKLPFRVSYDVKIGKMGRRGCVKIGNLDKHICIGLGASYGMGNTTYWSVSDNAIVEFMGDATFGKGTQIVVDGQLKCGANFYCNANCIINAGKSIIFGDDNLIGWNVTIIDGDGHDVIHNGKTGDRYEEIKLGNHVWIAAQASILKGTVLQDGCVVAFGGLASKSYQQENLLIGGTNKIIGENIVWNK